MKIKEAFVVQEDVLPGSPSWESVCEQCGLCCLIKVFDTFGRVWLTDIRCDMLDPETRKCKCYPKSTSERNSKSGCSKHNCRFLDMDSLHNDYIVPACCAYVQYFCDSDLVKMCAKRPDIDWSKTVPESSVLESSIVEHLVPGSCNYFKYNPTVNEALCVKSKGR